MSCEHAVRVTKIANATAKFSHGFERLTKSDLDAPGTPKLQAALKILLVDIDRMHRMEIDFDKVEFCKHEAQLTILLMSFSDFGVAMKSLTESLKSSVLFLIAEMFRDLAATIDN